MLESISFRYRRTHSDALDRVTIRAEPGEVVGVVGHNGAGKTTLLLVAAGILTPREGCVHIPAGSSRGVLTEKLSVYQRFTVEETLRVFASVMKGSRADVGSAMEELGLTEHAGVWVRRLSTGLRKRLLIALIALRKPDIVLLDEPFAGLDPESVEILIALLEKWRSDGHAVVVSSHDLPELERIVDSVHILQDGQVIDTWSPRAELDSAVVAVETDLGLYECPCDTGELRRLMERLDASGEQIRRIGMRDRLLRAYQRAHRSPAEHGRRGDPKAPHLPCS